MVAGLNRIGQRLFIDKPAASRVDDDLPLLRLAQKLRGEHASGLWSLRQVNGDKVRAAHQLFKLNQLHAQGRRTRGVGIWIISDDFCFKRCQALREQLTNVAKADDADGLAEDFHALERRTLPFCITQGCICLRNLTCRRQQQGNGVLTRGVNIGGWCVDNHDAACGSCGNVNVIEANACAAYNLEVVSSFEDFLINGGCRTNQESISFAYCPQKFIAVWSINPADLNFLPQSFNGGWGKFVGN